MTNALVVIALTLLTHCGLCAETALVGTNFLYPLESSMFFKSLSSGGDDITMTASLRGKPDLPSWLHLVEDTFHQMAFLYGTPRSIEDSAIVRVIARNKNTQTSSIRFIEIQVKDRAEVSWYSLELPILNLDLTELFREDNLEALQSRMNDLWPKARGVKVTGVTSLAEAQGRIPVPDKPGQFVGKAGVLVEMSGLGDFSPLLKNAASDALRSCDSHMLINTAISIDSHFRPDFLVDWCNLKLMGPFHADTTSSPGSAAVIQPVDLSENARLSDPPEHPRRDFSNDFWVTIVFPCVLGLLLCVMLSYIMFGRREGVERRDERTPETQLNQFNTIRRATTNLRLMSNRRDGPPPLNTNTVTPSSGDRSREPTLTRNQPPPPYRLPPSFNSDQSPGIEVPASEIDLRAYDDPRNEDDEHLVPRTPGTRRA